MFCFVVVFETQSPYVALVYWKLSMQTRLASKSQRSSCLSLLDSGNGWNVLLGRNCYTTPSYPRLAAKRRDFNSFCRWRNNRIKLLLTSLEEIIEYAERLKQEKQKFKTILGYTASLRSARTTWNPVSKRRRNRRKRRRLRRRRQWKKKGKEGV